MKTMTQFQATTAELPQEASTARGPAADLIKMHAYRRPAGSMSEKEFINVWIDSLGTDVDKAGNRIVKVGPDKPKMLWSCHTDTVHLRGGFQRLHVAGDNTLRLTKRERKRSSCLGADDTVGCWLAREMILEKVPGLYIFHREEESFGRGSDFIAHDTPKLLEGIQAAVAFDRKGTGSIITHQMSGRCCSENFVTSLSSAIGLNMKADSGGTFTDTANYTDLVPECTNISVGYQGQHTPREQLDINFALKLREAMLEFDADKLVIEREPGTGYEEFDWEGVGYTSGCGHTKYDGANKWSSDAYHATASLHRGDLAALVRRYPEVAVDLLEGSGVDSIEFEKAIDHYYGMWTKQ
jgi:hypothetical protein